MIQCINTLLCRLKYLSLCSSESGGVHSGGAAEEDVRTTGSGLSPEEVLPTDSGPEDLQETSEGPEVVVPDTKGLPESEKVQDYSVEIQDVSPEGEEPPSEVMVQEVHTQATTVVLTKPTTEPESVILETNPVLDPEPKDSSLGITRDVPSTQEVEDEDLPETPESVEEGTLAEPEEDPLETEVDESEEDPLETEVDESEEDPLETVTEEEAEVPSQASFLTTDRTIEEVSEAPEDQLSSGVTSDPFVLILQEDEDATVEPEEDLVLIEEVTKEYAEVIPTTAGLPAKEEEPAQGVAAVEDPVQKLAEETEITEVPAQEVVHVEDTGLVEEAELVEDKEPRGEPTEEDGLVEIAEETVPTRGITQEYSGEEVGEPESEGSEPEVAEEAVSESLLLTEPEVPEPEDPEEEPESVPEEEPESVPEEEPESVPEEEPESVPEEEVVQEGPSEISPEVGTPTGAGTAEPQKVLEEVPVEVLPEGPLVEVPAENTPGPLLEVPAEKVEATTKYVVEYNNGNFPALTERPLDLDGFGNSFGLEDEDSIGNEIDGTLLWPQRALKEQVVELSLKLRGETFSDALRDPSSTQYQLLDRHFIRR
ncbi:fibrous sheath CABYR-binding protein-like, partial [Notothenia coriiceps]|uniref:Fibrous sheath CABYR-binding protein-like n=1 Tax=Notothenia coriiceps TaxID=8208 RepID=A0A6I9N2F8_9TELE